MARPFPPEHPSHIWQLRKMFEPCSIALLLEPGVQGRSVFLPRFDGSSCQCRKPYFSKQYRLVMPGSYLLNGMCPLDISGDPASGVSFGPEIGK